MLEKLYEHFHLSVALIVVWQSYGLVYAQLPANFFNLVWYDVHASIWNFGSDSYFLATAQVHWGFYQPLNWAWLAWVRRKTHSVVWGLMEKRGTTADNFKQLYSHISQITYHSITQLMTHDSTSLWEKEKNNN